MTKYVLVTLLVLAVATTGFAQSQPQSQSQSNARAQAYYHFSKARLLDDQGQANQAIEEFKKALELDPNNSLIYSEMAESYLRNNRPSDAANTASKAISIDPDNIEAHKLLSAIYLQVISQANAQRPPSADTINGAIREFEEIVRIDPTERNSFLMLGKLYQIKGDVAKAIDIYKRYLAVEPGSEEGVTALATLHLDAGNPKDAAGLLEGFVKQRPDSDVAFEKLGEIYTQMQEYDKAAEAYRRAAELDPDDVEIKKAQAQALYLDDKIDAAAKLYEDIIKAEPEDGIALLRLGQIYKRQMRYDLARANLQKAFAAFPDSIEIQFNLVMLDRDEGKLEDAVRRATEIIKKTEKANGRYSETDKQNRRIFLINQGILYQTLGNYDAAVRAFLDVKSLTGEKDGRVDGLIIETYRTARNLDKAVQYTEQALAESPDNRALKVLHADLIAERGKVDEGIRALQQLQKGNDDDLDILSAMVGVYQRARKYEQAQAILNTATQRFPNEQQVYFLQGALHEKQKKYDDAEKAFRKALEFDKDDPAVLNYLGYMFAVRGINLMEAEAMVQKAVELDPTNGAYLDSLGWVYFKQNRFDRAEEYLKKAAIFVNSDPDIHDHLGDLYFRTKRYDEARNEWNKSIQLSTEQEDINRVKKKLDDLRTNRAANK
jgi:tetratricopeptide (TPR) repeat protein